MTSTPSTPTPSNTLLLRRQLTELTKKPVEGFSAGTHHFVTLHHRSNEAQQCAPFKGLVDDNNLYEWEVMIIGYVSPLTV